MAPAEEEEEDSSFGISLDSKSVVSSKRNR